MCREEIIFFVFNNTLTHGKYCYLGEFQHIKDVNLLSTSYESTVCERVWES